jgi:hypothetical protein
MQQSGESEPFIDEILRNLQRITSDLSPLQIHTFYEAVGYMISAQPNKPQQEQLIANLMAAPNAAWDSLMAQAAQSGTEILSDPENIKILSNILKTNTAACSSIGTFFLPQLARIYMDLLGLYTAVSGIISATTAEQGLIATKTPKVRGLRTIKKEILKLVGETYIRKAEDLEQVNRDLVPPLLEAILGDYKQNIPAARDAEVLSTSVTIVSRLGVSGSSSRSRACVPDTDFSHAASDDQQGPGCLGRCFRMHARDDQPRLDGISRVRFIPSNSTRHVLIYCHPIDTASPSSSCCESSTSTASTRCSSSRLSSSSSSWTRSSGRRSTPCATSVTSA